MDGGSHPADLLDRSRHFALASDQQHHRNSFAVVGSDDFSLPKQRHALHEIERDRTSQPNRGLVGKFVQDLVERIILAGLDDQDVRVAGYSGAPDDRGRADLGLEGDYEANQPPEMVREGTVRI